jgi:hypothetical protein
MLINKLEKFLESFPSAAIAKVSTTKIEKISKDDDSPSDFSNKIFLRNIRGFNLVGSDMFQKVFGNKLDAVFSFTSTKSISIFFENNDKYLVINPIAKEQDLASLDFMLNTLYCDETPNIQDNIKNSILFSIKNNKIEKHNKNKFNEQEITRLYWLSLRTVDIQLSAIVSSRTTAKITSYCLLFKDIIIHFKNDPNYGKRIFILEYPANTILPFSDLRNS